ncbi:retrovirus-related Pol polyprotein from transposon opus [Trichonephila clavipes]|nr:retrovirus-related Pol polyprotein from transposon opus [Trichonephila clavipes]
MTTKHHPKTVGTQTTTKKVKSAILKENPLTQSCIASKLGMSLSTLIKHKYLKLKMMFKPKVHLLLPKHIAERKTNCRKLHENLLAAESLKFAVTLDEKDKCLGPLVVSHKLWGLGRDFDQSLERVNKRSVRGGDAPPIFGNFAQPVERLNFTRNQREYSACVEVGTIDLTPAKRCHFNNFKNYFSSNDITCEEVVGSVFICVEENQCFSSIIGYIVRASNKVVEDLDGTVESTNTIAKLKTKIENSSTFESDADFVKTLIKNCIDERVSRIEREAALEKQKIELAKLQLAQSENFNLFFQSLERAFLTKKINDEYKSEILINLLGERAHNVLLYIKKEELNDYEKLKSIVLREFQVTPRECLNSFKNAVKSSGETYIQFAARLTANFQCYCSLRKVNSFESLCDLLISDKLFETLNKETATHIGIRGAEDWFRPIDLAKECDIYISSRSGSRKETPIACGYTEDPFKNRPRNYKPKIKDSYPQNLERQNKNCYICGDSSHYARDCEKRFKPKESNGHIHNRKNANSLKVKSEKQKSDEFAQQLQCVNIFVENQPVIALIDSGCQIPVLNSSLIRLNKPSEGRITLRGLGTFFQFFFI